VFEHHTQLNSSKVLKWYRHSVTQSPPKHPIPFPPPPPSPPLVRTWTDRRTTAAQLCSLIGKHTPGSTAGHNFLEKHARSDTSEDGQGIKSEEEGGEIEPQMRDVRMYVRTYVYISKTPLRSPRIRASSLARRWLLDPRGLMKLW
jgi:hypothetical protein